MAGQVGAGRAVVAGAFAVADGGARSFGAGKLRAGGGFIEQQQSLGSVAGTDDLRSHLGVECEGEVRGRNQLDYGCNPSAGAGNEDVGDDLGLTFGADLALVADAGRAGQLGGQWARQGGEREDQPAETHRLPPAGAGTKRMRGSGKSPSNTH